MKKFLLFIFFCTPFAFAVDSQDDFQHPFKNEMSDEIKAAYSKACQEYCEDLNQVNIAAFVKAVEASLVQILSEQPSTGSESTKLSCGDHPTSSTPEGEDPASGLVTQQLPEHVKKIIEQFAKCVAFMPPTLALRSRDELLQIKMKRFNVPLFLDKLFLGFKEKQSCITDDDVKSICQQINGLLPEKNYDMCAYDSFETQLCAFLRAMRMPHAKREHCLFSIWIHGEAGAGKTYFVDHVLDSLGQLDDVMTFKHNMATQGILPNLQKVLYDLCRNGARGGVVLFDGIDWDQLKVKLIRDTLSMKKMLGVYGAPVPLRPMLIICADTDIPATDGPLHSKFKYMELKPLKRDACERFLEQQVDCKRIPEKLQVAEEMRCLKTHLKKASQWHYGALDWKIKTAYHVWNKGDSLVNRWDTQDKDEDGELKLLALRLKMVDLQHKVLKVEEELRVIVKKNEEQGGQLSKSDSLYYFN